MINRTALFWLIRAGVIFVCTLFCWFQPVLGNDKTKNKKIVEFGIISDVHDDTTRIRTFVDQAKNKKLDFIIQLGDLSNGKMQSNRNMITIWNSYPGKKYHVLGNHELDYATKDEIIRRQEMPGAYYSFDYGAYHFVVLDCNFIRKEGKFIDFGNANYYIAKEFRDLINPDQLIWLKEDIQKTDKHVIIFSHQTFDDIIIRGSNPVPNRSEVRNLIQEINSIPTAKNKVIACFAGHDHLDHYNQIDGVHYFAVNSALGFKSGLEIKDALFGFVTLNEKKHTISVKGVKSEFKKSPTDKDYGHYPKDLIFPFIRDRIVCY